MHKTISLMLLAFLIPVQAAVHISSNGKAQAMIVPYYSVANGLTTLLTVNNTTEEFKAIKVHLREGRKGDAIYSFNLYLAPKDMWAAGLVDNNGFVNIITTDLSCVFNLNNLIGPPPQTPEDSWEWQTGMLEIIEMGVVDTSQLPAINNQNRCQVLQDAWDAQGPNSLWRADGTNAMLPISGGLQAHTRIINVSNGFSFEVPNIHIEDFYPPNSLDNQPPESTTPNLDSGDHKSLLIHNGEAILTEWPTGYEAISALLMKTTLENEFETDPAYGAVTEWVISFPTAHYHLSNNETTIPFITDAEYFRFPIDLGFNWLAHDREGLAYRFECFILCPPTPLGTINHSVHTYLINPEEYDFSASIISGVQRENVKPFDVERFYFNNDPTNGKISLFFDDNYYYEQNNRGLSQNNLDQHIFHGLPVVGFAFQRYINANAYPGLMATYATARPHFGDREIEIISNEGQ